MYTQLKKNIYSFTQLINTLILLHIYGTQHINAIKK